MDPTSGSDAQALVLWTDAARKKVHPTRQTPAAPAPTPPQAKASKAKPKKVDREKLFSTVAETFAKHTIAEWKAGEAHADATRARHMRAVRLLIASPAKAAKATALDLEEQATLAAMLPGWWGGAKQVWPAVIGYWVDVAGAAFAVEAIARSTDLVNEHGDRSTPKGFERWTWIAEAEGERTYGRDKKLLRHALRAYLATADDASYAAAKGAAARIRGSAHPIARRQLAYAFPGEPAWSEEDAAVWLAGPPDASGYGLLASLRDLSIAERILDRAIEEDHHTDAGAYVHTLVATFGAAAAPGIGRLLASVIAEDVDARYTVDPDPREAAAEALSLIATVDAAQALVAGIGDKTVMPILSAYAARAPRAAAEALAPVASGRGKTADAAAALLGTIQRAHPEALASGAEGGPGGPGAPTAKAPLAEASPSELPRALTTSDKPAKLPAYWDPTSLPRLRLASNEKALPREAVDRLASMIIRRDPLLADVKRAIDAGSLADLAWAVFHAWQFAKMPSDAFVFEILGAFGDDAVARRLAPILQAWPGEGGTARAIKALSVFEAIGTDTALMLLFQVGEKVRFRALKAAAQRAISEIAKKRGMSREELGDRLVPDLGLDAGGSKVLDFGARSFRVGFDEELRPLVRDATGKKLSDLPKPGKADDPKQAAEAVAQWKRLKAEARAVASGQVARFERALKARRRWDGDAFRALIVDHPLVTHIARRLLWAAYDGRGRPAHTFRVSEDGSLAGADDAAFVIPRNAKVGLVHPLELDAAALSRWGEVFADYGIVQPFSQIGRPVHRPTDAERKVRTLKRVDGRVVPAGKVVGLERRGFVRGGVGDGGVVTEMVKELEDGAHIAELSISPGLYVGMIGETPEQRLGKVVIERRSGKGRAATIEDVDPVAFSELVLDLESLLA
jgi:hypothetical protein